MGSTPGPLKDLSSQALTTLFSGKGCNCTRVGNLVHTRPMHRCNAFQPNQSVNDR
jgi:hypothetical protein